MIWSGTYHAGSLSLDGLSSVGGDIFIIGNLTRLPTNIQTKESEMREKLLRIKAELKEIDEKDLTEAEKHIWDIVKEII
jgi:hypothetical protein